MGQVLSLNTTLAVFDELQFSDDMDKALRNASAIVWTVMDALEDDISYGHLCDALAVARDVLDRSKETMDEWDESSRKPRAIAEQAQWDAERAGQPVAPMSPEQIVGLEALIAESKKANKAAARTQRANAKA